MPWQEKKPSMGRGSARLWGFIRGGRFSKRNNKGVEEMRNKIPQPRKVRGEKAYVQKRASAVEKGAQIVGKKAGHLRKGVLCRKGGDLGKVPY